MTTTVLPPRLIDRSLFLVWGPPSHAHRSTVFARTIGIPIEFLFGTRRRGGWIAPFKYAYQAIATVWLLARRRPLLVFVQSPPSLAPLVVAMFGPILGVRFVVDAHSDALMSRWWTKPTMIHDWVRRRAVTTIVTNRHFASLIEGSGGHATIIRDIPTTFPEVPVETGPGFHVLLVNTFADDEPLGAVMDAAARLDDVTFHVTGNQDRPGVQMPGSIPANVVFTGYLPDPEYYGLMRSVDAVMCLTTRDHTMQRGACEALSMGVPIITSDWPLLRDYFHAGTVHVGSSADEIETGVLAMRSRYSEYLTGIVGLQEEQHNEWERAVTGLIDSLDETARGDQGTK